MLGRRAISKGIGRRSMRRMVGGEPLERRLVLSAAPLETSDEIAEIGAPDVADAAPLAATAAPVSASAEQEMVDDFQLLDVNTTSPTYNQAVSPRDYLQQVSAWYFGHAT